MAVIAVLVHLRALINEYVISYLRWRCNTFALSRAVKLPEVLARLHTAAGLNDQVEPKDNFHGTRGANSQNTYRRKYACLMLEMYSFLLTFIHFSLTKYV